MALLRIGSPAIRLGLLVVLAAWCPGHAGDRVVEEQQAKAAYLYNFAKFVEWPTHSYRGDRTQIAICVLGGGSFASALDEVVRGKSVSGRTFAVRQISNIAGGSDCQILFIRSSEQSRFRSVLASVKGSGILTVSEISGFAAAGGVINFKLEDGRLRFEINVQAAEREHLYISSKLLNLADIVKERD